jgi:type IV fimbrial biogenesis protein FimT
MNGGPSIDDAALGAGMSRRCAVAHGGFTVLELLVTMAIAAILLAIAVPSFRDAALSNRLNAVSSDLVASVQLARSEAIKRNVTVTLCASSNGTSCSLTATPGWEQGWIMLSGGDRIQTQQALPAGWKVTQAGGTSSLSFQPIGVGASAANFTICRSAPIGRQERLVTVSATGVAYVTRTETGSCT